MCQVFQILQNHRGCKTVVSEKFTSENFYQCRAFRLSNPLLEYSPKEGRVSSHKDIYIQKDENNVAVK